MSRLRLPLPALVPLALFLACALAGCGHTVRVGNSRHLVVALTEYRVTPETVRAYAGTLTITVRNVGTRTHNLEIISSLPKAKGLVSPDLAPGASATMLVDLAPGRYMMRSTVTDDQSLGLWGSLDVVATRKR
jgi:uncharacterized cupredoxin-like copper-binding protein